VERLGAPVSACLTNSTPLFAIVLAVFFLGERPTVTNLLGAFPLSQGLFRSHGAAPPKHGALATYSFH
jgi:drug/metabolite transporter (DMT)-like permease